MIPRAAFLPPQQRSNAAADAPLPIGAGQTTSQPSLVKRVVAALELTGGERVLEVGAGTGYAAAALARAVGPQGKVYAIERVRELAARADAILAQLRLDNVQVMVGDGSKGLPQHAPYDAIMVSAAMPVVPPPLLTQLAAGGRLVMPVGAKEQRLLKVTRVGADQFQSENLGPVKFVPLKRDPGRAMSALAAQDQYGQRP